MKAWQPGLVERHRKWQVNSIFQKKYHKGESKREQRKKRVQIQSRQQEIDNRVRQGAAALANYMRSAIDIPTPSPFNIPEFNIKLTPNEFLDPPFELEQRIAASLAGQVSRAHASHPAFWFTCHAKWISTGKFVDDLPQAMLAGQNIANKQGLLEHQTRNFIRRTGGIDVVRSRTSVFSDCTIARAWWRREIASDAAKASQGELDVDTAHRILSINNPAWESFVTDALRRVPVANHARLRAAILCQFEDAGVDAKAAPPNLRAVGRELARLGASASLQHIPWPELLEVAKEAADNC